MDMIYVGRNNLQNDELTFHLCDRDRLVVSCQRCAGLPCSGKKHKDGEMPILVLRLQEQ